MSVIYKITNLVNNKIYIGQTNNKRRFYFGGGVVLHKAIKKYGKENFYKEILVEGDFNREELDRLEVAFIAQHKATNPIIGYNIMPGGFGNKGFVMKEETKLKLSISKKRNPIPLSEERKIKLKESFKNYLSIPENKEKLDKRLRKLAIERIGKSRNPEIGLKISKSKKGKKFTDSHKRNMSLTHINNPKLSKPILLFRLDGTYIGEYPSMSEAARQYSLSVSSMCQVVKGTLKQTKGFIIKARSSK